MLHISQIIQISIGVIATAIGLWVINQVDIDDQVNEKVSEFKQWKYHKAVVGIAGIILLYLIVTQILSIITCMTNPYCNGSIHLAQTNTTIELLNGVGIP